jgi:hypothetical protein
LAHTPKMVGACIVVILYIQLQWEHNNHTGWAMPNIRPILIIGEFKLLF